MTLTAPAAGRDLRTLLTFVDTFCREKHAFRDRVVVEEHLLSGRPVFLCPRCVELLQHIVACRTKCTHDAKPDCMHCPGPCFEASFRRRIREVMRFSGRYLAFHGHPQYLLHLFH
ncbi:MAG TPA: nitrous oxide-stimulated promoter family protein [Phycisphaerae bacterium]|nr:nitrous oxide-stimulated promoter family protein [Phycisphaerae bacterium]